MRITRFRKPDFQEKLAKARGYRRKTESTSRGRLRIAHFLSGGAILILLYFLAVSNYFLVKKAEMGSEGVTAEEAQSVLEKMGRHRLLFLIPGNHIVLLTRQSLLQAFQSEMPEIRSIKSFKKVFPDSVQLEIEVREPLYVWQSGADFYLLDQDGVAFEKIPGYTPDIYSEILITDRTAEPLAEGELEVKKILAFIEKIKVVWPQKISQTPYASFSIPGTSSPDIFVRTGIGFEVYFDIERSVERQIDNLALLLNREIKPETHDGLSYIDLRLPTAAYYCYKDAPCAAESK